MEIVILVIFLFNVMVVFFAAWWFLRIIDATVDDLYSLFMIDEEKWWWEKELPKAIGKSGFLTRTALNLLDEKGKLRKRVLSIKGIRVFPQEGGERPGVVLLVKLDNDGSPRKKKRKAEVVRISPPNTLGQIPTYS